jgi:ubiquinone biosynthesis protein COQ4
MTATLWPSAQAPSEAPTGALATEAPGAGRPDPHFRILGTLLAMSGGDTSLELVEALTDALLPTPSYALAAQQLRRDPGCAALIEARWVPEAHDLQQLAALPEGSLGQAYAAAVARLGYDPNLHAGMEASSEAMYVELRLSQTHDLWHLLTGYDSSLEGEIGLQAFHLGQFPYPLAALLIAEALISTTLGDPAQLPVLVEAVYTGLAMGRQARPLFAQRWEEGWAKPLEQWRRELNLIPATQGH